MTTNKTENFSALKNDLFLRAPLVKIERAPVWIMRQAGRYLPEFHKIRKNHSYFEVCRTPELACQLTLQTIDRYGKLLDASIIFSDILVIPQAMGLEVFMVPGKEPVFPAPLDTPADFSHLTENVDVEKELGAPWTLMAYMIEGGGI
ncbi:uncharacterized protein EV154DRAFT_561483 [Mucor mucedo]|uniref:uncharacterized protein n=1 Tax=Mucor mucedo TaxID=29922 RepID=UPI00221F2508|nr:uncharacterized protein EV154DRAFT_561483 [Mucor mucedo]KAI7893260.1 hypothetical protein EV154DRAFT_561483 [Mucor mucedo]